MQWANRVAWSVLAVSVLACLCLLAYVVHGWGAERHTYVPSVTTLANVPDGLTHTGPARTADPQNSGW